MVKWGELGVEIDLRIGVTLRRFFGLKNAGRMGTHCQDKRGFLGGEKESHTH